MFGASQFNSGQGTDFADICGDEATLVSVELIQRRLSGLVD